MVAEVVGVAGMGWQSGDSGGERKMGGSTNWVVAGCHAAFVASGWRGVVRGWLVSGVLAVEWMGGEPEGAEQLLLHPSRWTPDQRASNVGCWNRACPTLDAAYSSVQRAQLAKGCKKAWTWA